MSAPQKAQAGTRPRQTASKQTSLGQITIRQEQSRTQDTGGRGETVTTRRPFSTTRPRQTASKPTNLGQITMRQEQSRTQDTVGGRGETVTTRRPFSTTRRSSTGSTISSISSEDTKQKTTSSNNVKQRLSKDTLAKIGNRQIKVVNQEKKKCSSCSKPLTEDGFFALGQLYHKTCFRCKYCTVKLSQIFFVREDQPCCAKCHKEKQEDCWVCKKKISDDHIFCNKKFYHPRCMKCYVCGDQLRDRYLTYKDQPVCEKDFKAIGHVCSVCDQIITGEVYVVDEAYFCEKDFEAISSTGTCAVCEKDISPDDSLAVGDVLFHHGCLSCQVCNKNMEGKSITLDNKNRVYCTEDYARKFCSMCAVCKKSIVPKKGQTKVPRLKAMGKDFHLDCFKCEDCSLVLSPGVRGKECWPIGQHLLCYRCNTKRQDESERESE